MKLRKTTQGKGNRAVRTKAKTRPRAEGNAPAGESEALLRPTLDALSAHIAVLDRIGEIVTVNQAWRNFARANGFAGADGGVGMNYLAICDRAAGASAEAAQTAAALRGIIRGRRSVFRLEYPCDSVDGPRWFQLRITRPEPLKTPRVVIAHEDITEVKHAQGSLARLSSRLLQVQDDERRAIARDLHDTTAQNLLAIVLNATRLRDQPDGAGQPHGRICSDIVELAEQCLREVRTLSYVLHPPLLDERGLGSALRWFAIGFSERSGILVDLRVDEDNGALPREIATTLFRVAQEALSNVHRHSGSPTARIELQRIGSAIRLEIGDQGRGLRPEIDAGANSQSLGVGISGMRIRLEQLGGRLEIRSKLSGTNVTATVPLPPAASDIQAADARLSAAGVRNGTA